MLRINQLRVAVMTALSIGKQRELPLYHNIN
jgi:hypothetical protein